jgi:hypothetical protein
MALQKAKNLGINLEVDTYDNKNSFEEIDKIANSKKIKNHDFILGPFIPRNINRLSSMLSEFNTPIVSHLN